MRHIHNPKKSTQKMYNDDNKKRQLLIIYETRTQVVPGFVWVILFVSATTTLQYWVANGVSSKTNKNTTKIYDSYHMNDVVKVIFWVSAAFFCINSNAYKNFCEWKDCNDASKRVVEKFTRKWFYTNKYAKISHVWLKLAFSVPSLYFFFNEETSKISDDDRTWLNVKNKQK